jgi:hypothetical protein
MIVTIYRPDEVDGPWLIMSDDGRPGFWSPSPASWQELDAMLANDLSGRFEAEQDGDQLRLGRRLPMHDEPPES